MTEIWAACQDSDMGPLPVGYFSDRELAKQLVVREFRASDEAEEEDWEDSWEERKVKQDIMGIPVHPVPRFNLNRMGFRPKWRGHPDGDLQLAVWQNTGPYGPGWHITEWLVERIKVLDALEPEEEVA